MWKNIIDIFMVFLKVGVIGFGGGSALIPVIEKEVVEKKKWFTEEEYLKHTIIANITPGTLPTKLGAIAGYELGGSIGSLAGAYAVTLPGVIMTIAIIMLFNVAGSSITHYIEFASVGISVFIISLLIMYILKVINSGRTNNLYKSYITICVLAFLITGGTEVRYVINSIVGREIITPGSIIFDISTIKLITIAFFMILFYGLLKTKGSFVLGLIISLAYVIVTGKNEFLSNSKNIENILMIIMIGLVIYALKSDLYKGESKKIKVKFSKQMYTAMGLFIGVPIIILVIALIMMINDSNLVIDVLGYGIDVTTSTLTSFGGGEAYVAVADGFFVQTGLIDAGDFYNKLVAVANALPGPILVKIASGVGYMFAGSIGGVVFGFIIALLGMSLAVGSCCVLALIVLMGYDSLKDSEALKLLKIYILPVVCGMLISTSLSMIVEVMKITSMVGISGMITFPVIVVSLVGLYIVHKNYHVNDIILLIICALTSFVAINGIYI